jgi:hypothetical protein
MSSSKVNYFQNYCHSWLDEMVVILDLTFNKQNFLIRRFSSHDKKDMPYSYVKFLNGRKSCKELIFAFFENSLYKDFNNDDFLLQYPIFFYDKKESSDCGDFVLNVLKNIFPEEFSKHTQLLYFFEHFVFNRKCEDIIKQIPQIYDNSEFKVEVFEDEKKAKRGDIIFYNNPDEYRDEYYHVGIYLGNSWAISNGYLLYKHKLNEIQYQYNERVRFIRINYKNYESYMNKYLSLFESLNWLAPEIDRLKKDDTESVHNLVNRIYEILYKNVVEKKSWSNVKKEIIL